MHGLLLRVVTVPWHLNRWQLLTIKRKKFAAFSKKALAKFSKKENGRRHFGQCSESGFNWLAGMEKWCLYIIISIVFLNNKLGVAFFFSLFIWPVA